jgi:phosphomannomutase
MAKTIISVSGLRGVIGESLDPAIAIYYACAFAGQLQPGPIVVARDGRSTGRMLAAAITSGLLACGRRVLDAGIAATPTVGILVRDTAAAGGIQISASHNPAPYNGIKLFGRDGRVISASQGRAVMERFERRDIAWVAHDQIGTVGPLEDTTTRHLDRVLATVDVAAIRRRRFRVVLDSNHGAGSILARRLFDTLGVEAHILGDSPDGQFEHPPEPTSENLKYVAQRAVPFGADVVFCQDPDADRLAIIDERGQYIGEEYTLAITLWHRLRAQPGAVVVNCATSRMSTEIAEQMGCMCHLSAVGEANVTDVMQAVGAVYGGEGNGGPIDPRVGYVRDSFVAMAQVLDALAQSDASVSQLIRDLPQYAIHKSTINLEPSRIPAFLTELEFHNREARISRLDGVRLDWPDRWLLVRPSNTEPIVRAIAEARNEATAKALCEMAARMVK